MNNIHETEEKKERVLLVGVMTRQDEDTEKSLEELKELGRTAGVLTVGTIIQRLENQNPATYIGKGKIEEVRLLAQEMEADSVICDDELSPAQLSNLQDALQMKVIDRTILILDIFAQHATSREGKIQVELAQLRYRATRLVGMRQSLSRLGGGIGTRGPGEKKLEMDRRFIKERISQLKKELEQVKKSREVARKQREKSPVPVVAIVGYTNAGKSTLLNQLTDAGIREENLLFATLDPTTRKRKLESGQEILLTDTVGFIRKLPHHLIEAFRSTLEEAKYADIILHVTDASNPDADTHMYVVYQTLRDLDVSGKPVITVFNKMDAREKLPPEERIALVDHQADEVVCISAKNGEGTENLLRVIEKILQQKKQLMEKCFPYEEAGKIQLIRKYGQILEEEYREDGIYVRAFLPMDIYQKLQQ